MAKTCFCDAQRVASPLCEQGPRNEGTGQDNGGRGVPSALSGGRAASAAIAKVSPPWALDCPTASCCLCQRKARETEAILMKRAVLQAEVNTSTTLAEVKGLSGHWSHRMWPSPAVVLPACPGGTYCTIQGQARLGNWCTGNTRNTEAFPC